MPPNTQMHLLLLSELVFALRANDPATFKRWLSGGIQDLGKPAIKELMIQWLNPLLTQDEADRLVGWLAFGALIPTHPQLPSLNKYT